MKICIHDTDVLKTEHGDPIKWLKEAYSKAATVVFFNSPDIEVRDSTFRKMFDIALHFRDSPNQNHDVKKTILGVHFPFTNKSFEKDIRAHKYFELPKNLNSFIYALSNDKSFLFFKKILIKKDSKFKTMETRLKKFTQDVKDEIYRIKQENKPQVKYQFVLENKPRLPRCDSADGDFSNLLDIDPRL